MDEFFNLPGFNLDDELFLNRSENRKKLVVEWKRLTGIVGKEFDILVGYLTAYEYKCLFRTDKVTVVLKESKEGKKRLLKYYEQVLLAQLEKEQLIELQKEFNLLDKFLLEKRIERIAKYILKIRGIRK